MLGFLVLVLRSLRLSRLAADAGMPLHACIAAGFGVWIGLQAFLNIGVNMGLLPTKGLTLPLLSYGRSSMLVTLAWIGMLLRVHHEVAASGKSALPPEGRVEMSRTVMIMAGGTGGHVFPALAIAGELRAVREIVWLGTERGIEARLVPAAGYPVEWIEVEGLRGKGVGRWLGAPLSAAARGRPGAARAAPPPARRRAGLGGFASGPGGIAAWLAGTPLVIHEQNAVAGLTNRWLARFASRVAEGFPGSFPAGRGAIYVGNPVRPEIAALPPPRQRFESRERDAAPVRVRRQPGRLRAQPPGAGSGGAACPRPAGRSCCTRRARRTAKRRRRPIARPACRRTCALSSTTWRPRTRRRTWSSRAPAR